MRYKLLLALAVVVVLAAFVPGDALACHACVAGEPCPPHGGCGGDGFGPSGKMALSFTAEDGSARWTFRGRWTQSRADDPRRDQFRSRVRCVGTACVGHRGVSVLIFDPEYFGGHFEGGAKFRRGAGCRFVRSTMPIANQYECWDRFGNLDGRGSFTVAFRSLRWRAAE